MKTLLSIALLFVLIFPALAETTYQNPPSAHSIVLSGVAPNETGYQSYAMPVIDIVTATVVNADDTTATVTLSLTDAQVRYHAPSANKVAAATLPADLAFYQIAVTLFDANRVVYRAHVINPGATPVELLGRSFQVYLNTHDDLAGATFAGGRIWVVSSYQLQPGATLYVDFQGTNLAGAGTSNCWLIGQLDADVNSANNTASQNYQSCGPVTAVEDWITYE